MATKSGKYELVGLQGGIETVVYRGTYSQMRSWLTFKERRHLASGFIVKKLATNSLFARKVYPHGRIKKRWIFIRKA